MTTVISKDAFASITIRDLSLMHLLALLTIPAETCVVTVIDGMLKVQSDGRVVLIVGPTFWKRADALGT